MGIQDFFRDAKNILLGNTENNYQPDFKEELDKAIKAGLITKAEAALLIETRNNNKVEAKEMDKKQVNSIALDDGGNISYEEAKAKKEEIERKKKERLNQQRAAMENVNNINKERRQVESKIRESNKIKNNSKKDNLKIDRNKLMEQMEQEEKLEKNINDIGRESKN